MERRAYRIRGRVQGVGFRWWTREAAAQLELSGTVRNARDGTVEIEVEGPAEALDRLEARLRDGPPPAHVESLEREAPAGEPLPEGFEIVH